MVNRAPLCRVDMRSEYDCGVACLATLTGLAPEAIEKRLGYRPEDTRIPEMCLGLLSEEVVLFLHQEGRHTLYLRTRADIEEEFDRYSADSVFRHTRTTLPVRRLIPDHHAVLALIQNYRAMLAVKHWTGDYGHFVIWDDGKILDPHPGRRVEREGLEDWEIRSAIVLVG